jgi:hypothetical protein
MTLSENRKIGPLGVPFGTRAGDYTPGRVLSPASGSDSTRTRDCTPGRVLLQLLQTVGNTHAGDCTPWAGVVSSYGLMTTPTLGTVPIGGCYLLLQAMVIPALGTGPLGGCYLLL